MAVRPVAPVLFPVDSTTKTGSVEFLHSVQAYVDDANRLWPDAPRSPALVRRYNKGTVRWPFPWTSKIISFSAVVTDLNGNTDGAFPVIVDGALFTYVQPGTNSLYPRRFYVPNLPIAPGGSHVEVWEPDVSRELPHLNTGLDGALHTGYITGVWLPPGQSIQRGTSDTCIITLGDSIPSSTNQAPAVFRGMVGQLRLLAQAQGWIVVSLDGGSFTLSADGPTPTQYSALIQQAVAATGATTVYVYFQIGRNDWKYWFNPTLANHTSAQVGAFLQSVVNDLPAAYNKIICTTVNQASPLQTDPYGTQPESLQDYRNAEALVTGTNVTHLDGTTFGIVPGTDLYDGVHELAPLLGNGVPKNLAGMRASVGLP